MRREDIRLRDPFVLPLAGRRGYVLYGTTDAEPWSGPGTGFDCYVSLDLESWVGPMEAFRPPEGFWGTTQFWAPEVYDVGGRYLMLATFSDGPIRGTQALVAFEPTGPFVPIGDGPLTPSGWSCLDGTLHIEGDAAWIVYCHEWTQVGDGQVVAQRLDSAMSRTVGEPTTLFTASEAQWSRPASVPGPDGTELHGYVTDGPFLYTSESGDLLMLWSSIGEHGYATGVARSESGSILGPWSQQPEPLWSADGGHAMLFRGPDHSLKLALHQPNRLSHERPVFIDVHDAGRTIELAMQPTATHEEDSE